MNAFNLSEWALKHKAVTLYFMLLTLVLGSVAFVQLGRAEDPNFTVKVMVISAQYPGATAQQVQDQVADLIERKVYEVGSIRRVETTSRPERMDMLVEFEQSVKSEQVPELFYQVRKRLWDLKLRNELPSGVQGPYVNDEFSDVYFSLYALNQGSVSDAQWVREAERLRDALIGVPGVQKVDVLGEQTQQIHLEFEAEKLSALGVTQAQILAQVQGFTQIQASGFVETQADRLYLRPTARFERVEELAQLPIQVGAVQVYLGDVARISRQSVQPSPYIIRNQGEPTLLLGVVMKRGENGLALADRLQAHLPDVQRHLPDGMRLTPVTNQGDAIALAVNTFEQKFLMALLVVMLVSFVTLGLRAGLVVALAIPLTLALTFVVMQLTGKNLDRITLGALILALGLLVDDAIIAIEMMLVKMREGLDRFKAASYAWKVTAAPMLFGTLVTVAGFVPIGFASSNVGEYAGNIFWILLIALSFSWLVAVTFTPYLGHQLLAKQPEHTLHLGRPNGVWAERLTQWVTWSVHYRKRVVAGVVVCFMLSVVGMVKLVEKQFFPTSDRPELLIDIQLPEGTSQRVTDAVTQRVEAFFKAQPEVNSLSSYVGRGAPRFFLALNPELSNPAFGKLIVVTDDAQARDRLKARVQAHIDTGAFSEARVRVHPLLYGPPVNWPVTFRVMGEDLDQLRQIAQQVREVVQSNPYTHTANLEWGEQVKALELRYEPAVLARQGLTPFQLSAQLQAATQGTVLASVHEGTRRVLITQFNAQHTSDVMRQIDRWMIENAQGEFLPLSQVATLHWVDEEPVLKRFNRMNAINVNAEVQGAQPPDVTWMIDEALAPIRQALPPGYQIAIGGSVEESASAEASIGVLMPVMLITMLTLIMLNMRSFSGTFMVLMTAPLGLIGAVAAMLIFSQPFGFVANLGLIGLAGILMRNTLILVGQIHDNQAQGQSPYNAVIDATVRRARPVLLTALAAILAFIPLTTSTFWGPLAYVLIGGITVGTLLTLVFLPALYALWYRIKV